ncbi:OmpA family protein [Pinibacter soli]|uniref:OmpA family protein n=1 Tax=Pinibacter soli TaxID=3044211 RepID=A0ABT6RJ62_9BACT|nr:OmpA family protein [Pinibacter soli]MDI3322615.1 OmpA family protein [Pinibacter soli]
MKKVKSLLFGSMALLILASGCSTVNKMNKTEKGAVIGTAGGAAAGAVIGKIAGNAGLGAIIGAVVGGAGGAIIGRNMDKQAEQIKQTIPDAKVERVGEGIMVEFNSAVLFKVNKFDLSDQSKESLNKLITVLNTYPDTDIEVQGHTDSTGTKAYNQTLSVNRAIAVANYLLDHNINSSRVTTKGYGPDVPKYPNATPEGRTQNRRVEFIISANEKMQQEAKKQAGQQ